MGSAVHSTQPSRAGLSQGYQQHHIGQIRFVWVQILGMAWGPPAQLSEPCKTLCFVSTEVPQGDSISACCPPGHPLLLETASKSWLNEHKVLHEGVGETFLAFPDSSLSVTTAGSFLCLPAPSLSYQSSLCCPEIQMGNCCVNQTFPPSLNLGLTRCSWIPHAWINLQEHPGKVGIHWLQSHFPFFTLSPKQRWLQGAGLVLVQGEQGGLQLVSGSVLKQLWGFG